MMSADKQQKTYGHLQVAKMDVSAALLQWVEEQQKNQHLKYRRAVREHRTQRIVATMPLS